MRLTLLALVGLLSLPAVAGDLGGGDLAIAALSVGDLHGGDLTPTGATLAPQPVFDTGDPEDLTARGYNNSSLSFWTRDFPNTSGVAPKICYSGADISGTTWTAIIGPDLEQTGAGAFAEPDSPLGTSAQTVTNSHYYATGATLASDLIASGDDFYVEALQRLDATATTDYAWGLFSSDGGGGNSRFYHYNSDGNTYFQRDGSLTRKSLNAVATSGVWNVVSQAQTSGVTASAYVNGVSTDNDAFTETGGAPDTGWSVDIGALYTGSNAGAVSVGYLCFWSGDLFDNAAEQDAHAAKSFAIATGSALATPADTAPSVATRPSSSYLRICDPDDGGGKTTYHQVGDNWPRREVSCGYTWDDPTSSETQVSSLRVEPAATNEWQYSKDFDGASYTLANVTISAEYEAGPLGYDCDGFVGNAVDTSHVVRQTLSYGDAGDYDRFSFIAKAGNLDFLYFYKTGGFFDQWWDLTDCTAGTTSGSEIVAGTALGQDLGGGWCRLSVVVEDLTFGGAWSYLGAAEADNDATYVGDSSTVNITICHAQHESTGEDREDISSPIITVDATDVTRSQDTLRYLLPAALDTSDGFTLLSQAWNDSRNGADVNKYVYTVEPEGGFSTSRAGQTCDTNNRRRAVTRHDGQTLTSTSGVQCDIVRTARLTAAPGQSTFLYLNGTLYDTDAELITMPDAWDHVTVGAYADGSPPGPGNIAQLKFYLGGIAPGEQGTGDDTP